MPAKKPSADKKADQVKRFRQTAKEVEVDEDGKQFERALGKVIKPRLKPKR